VRRLALALLLAASLSSGQSTPSSAVPYQYFRVGAAHNIRVATHPGYALMGGGADLYEAFLWLCDRANGGDFLVLRAAGTDAYNPWLEKLCHLNSVATLVVPSRDAAASPFVAQTISSAAALFIAGGDQARYINFWAGTPVEAALRAAVKRGVPIGGTSAGLAVLGQYIYSAQNDPPDGPDLTSAVALANPFAKQIVIAPDLLGIPLLRGAITDSHFDTRHREGRLLTFMARILADGKASEIRGIGVDERTAVLVDADGHAHVVGKNDGEADFYFANRRPQECEPRKPLVFHALRTRVITGESFDMKNWRGPHPAVTVSENGFTVSDANR
jgi:cyanophycinase